MLCADYCVGDSLNSSQVVEYRSNGIVYAFEGHLECIIMVWLVGHQTIDCYMPMMCLVMVFKISSFWYACNII